MSERITLLCTGDLHLGRFPTRVPIDARGLSVEHVWKQTVSEAIRRKVNAVVLTGDVVDRQNAFFEAFGALKREVERLVEAGIGRDGRWEVTHLEQDGKRALNLVGWSYHQAHVAVSPLPDLPSDLDMSIPTVGLLHADLDQQESPYLPISAADLFSTRVPIWLLGHIHRPEHRAERGRHILYPGSPQPLHPGETGVHGPWLVEIEDGQRVRFEQLPLASLRYESLRIDVSQAVDLNHLQALTVRQITDQLQSLPQAQPSLQHIVARAVLTGRTRHHRELALGSYDWENRIATSIGDVGVTVEKLIIQTRPEHDLEEVAGRKDPAGALAQLLIGLQNGEASTARVVNEAAAELQALVGSNGFRPLAERLSPEAIELLARERVERQGLLLLDSLLAQADDGEGR
jgi:DNA repair protein SbcD/Mre11